MSNESDKLIACLLTLLEKLSVHETCTAFFSQVTAMTETIPITQLLRQVAAGDASANEQLLPLVYA